MPAPDCTQFSVGRNMLTDKSETAMIANKFMDRSFRLPTLVFAAIAPALLPIASLPAVLLPAVLSPAGLAEWAGEFLGLTALDFFLLVSFDFAMVDFSFGN